MKGLVHLLAAISFVEVDARVVTEDKNIATALATKQSCSSFEPKREQITIRNAHERQEIQYFLKQKIFHACVATRKR